MRTNLLINLNKYLLQLDFIYRYFFGENDKAKIITNLQKNFNHIKPVASSKLLTDLIEKGAETILLKYYHVKQLNQKSIDVVKNSLKHYDWPREYLSDLSNL